MAVRLPFCTSGARAPAVVIGKNQIPWREADLGWMRERRVALCRRASGGGAVYHDEGNVNWSVCVPRARYSARLVTDCGLEALADAGVRAHASGAASLVADGAKISGMAYAYRRDRVLHHGTLLGEADLDRLRRSLQPPAGQWETHGVRSEPMPVRNIGAVKSEIFQQAFAEGFVRLFPDGQLANENKAVLQAPADEHAPRLRSQEWVLGRSRNSGGITALRQENSRWRHR
jgi:lipoate---protein ligase